MRTLFPDLFWYCHKFSTNDFGIVPLVHVGLERQESEPVQAELVARAS